MSPWNPTLENEGNSNLDFIRSSLSSKTWFGFDLDDTLHEFRRASAHASSAVLTAVYEENPTISVNDLLMSWTYHSERQQALSPTVGLRSSTPENASPCFFMAVDWKHRQKD
ncbi:uncharacterized protein BDW43DRAFT_272053 [Aspergillus alliaceus]|uniref:uncharacterized protein n=1 Tax=Petromyces alliaceus TaxID=209559 RepID=UPI0012A3E3AB|nr:uncharacterized protein BDW43DRAFT_272053 [Aspergillus alliaceus]KAB8234973.1 hypothetical protein BDW43DRAFT_272053 [Aspergillus alliaceus]